MTHYHVLNLGWQNTSALSYPIQPHPQPPPPQPYYPNTITPGFPAVPLPFGMPPLPNSRQDNNRIDGVSLSYGFAPNVTPCNIPNDQSRSQSKGPTIGWSFGDKTDGACMSSQPVEDTKVENKQIEVVCRAIIVPDEDMPIYSFGNASVCNLLIGFEIQRESKCE